jgi:uroporphyrinogen decarboxylase
MNSRERISNILNHEPVDRIAATEQFWDDTIRNWRQQGHLRQGETPHDHFNLDLQWAWPFNYEADVRKDEEVVEETENTKLIRNGNGALLRYFKEKSGTPEHVDFLVKDRAGWEQHIKPYLLDEAILEKRINFSHYRQIRNKCHEKERFFTLASLNVFEMMHPMCGHEYMLMGMALDPDWVKDMCNVYAELSIKVFDFLFEREGLPDGVWYFEDMGFKQKPFMSPQMYREIVMPAHKKTFDYCHSVGLPIILHSCGYVEQLLPGLIEAGIDCLQAMETKAGMDLHKIKKQFGDKIALMGGLDIRVLEENNLEKVESFLRKMLPEAIKGSGYILHSDHSISTSVNYETYKSFLEKGLELGRYA